MVKRSKTLNCNEIRNANIGFALTQKMNLFEMKKFMT